MSALILPGKTAVEDLLKKPLLCQVLYGLEHCDKPATWKVVMACCGGSDFLCEQCMVDAAKTAPNQPNDYFGCGLCGVTHHSWKRGVKEVMRI